MTERSDASGLDKIEISPWPGEWLQTGDVVKLDKLSLRILADAPTRNQAAAAVEERNMHKIEYRVRPVTRYIVTRFERLGEETGFANGGVGQHGEFDNETVAYEVGYALARAEHERLGWPLDDPRLTYPTDPRMPDQKVG